MASKTREERIRNSTVCPVCGAQKTQACRKGIYAHDPRRGAEDLREHMYRAHDERRALWQYLKRQGVAV